VNIREELRDEFSRVDGNSTFGKDYMLNGTNERFDEFLNDNDNLQEN